MGQRYIFTTHIDTQYIGILDELSYTTLWQNLWVC